MKTSMLLLTVSCTALTGCASTRTWDSKSAASVQPMRDMHRACMVANAASLDDGAGHPQALVDTVESLCAPLLEPMRTYITQEGYGDATADAVVERVMMDNRREVGDVLVRVRAGARKAP